MTEVKLTKTRIRAGYWEGVLTGAEAAPEIEVVLLGAVVPGVTLTPIPGQKAEFALRVAIPAETLNDGVQTFLIRAKGGETLAHFTVITGGAMEDDLRAEVDLLRAELDMLKRAFRRHCVETAT
jgi:hypothetical protein